MDAQDGSTRKKVKRKTKERFMDMVRGGHAEHRDLWRRMIHYGNSEKKFGKAGRAFHYIISKFFSRECSLICEKYCTFYSNMIIIMMILPW